MDAKNIFERIDDKINQFGEGSDFLHPPSVILLGSFEVEEFKNLLSRMPGKAVRSLGFDLDGFVGAYMGLDIWEVKAEFRLEVY